MNKIDHKAPINYPLIIDGGLSNVLEDQGCDLNHQLWTAKLLVKNPEAIIQAHLEYIKAGAQCITTASYQASIPGLIATGHNSSEAKAIILKSVELVEIAIKRAMGSGLFKDRPLIAASVGPYGAYLADGSEYRGNYGVSDEALKTFHLDRIKILDGSNANILAFETIPSLQEAIVLSELVSQCSKPVWMSLSCKDQHHLNDGSKLEHCLSIFRNHKTVFALGVNCTKPEYISDIIKRIKENTGDKKIIVYPNSGEAYNAGSKSWMGVSDPDLFAEMAGEWLQLGVDIIGGCCQIGPKHIRRLKEMIQGNKY